MVSKQAFNFLPLSLMGASSILANTTPMAANRVSNKGRVEDEEPVLDLAWKVRFIFMLSRIIWSMKVGALAGGISAVYQMYSFLFR